MWAWLMLARVARLVEDLRTSDSADEAWRDMLGARLMVAEAIRHAVSPEDIYYPPIDAQMIAVMERDGTPVDPLTAPNGAVVEIPGGRIGLVTAGGLIESSGESLCIVPAAADRWLRAWLIPEIQYFEGAKA